MPFIPHTPESLVPRSDSKNPAATCRGLTSTGRPCRRAISKSPQASPSPSSRRLPSPEVFCWQHKEQAIPHASPSPNRIQSATMQERTSIDTLVDRLGLLEVEARKEERRHRRKQVPGPDAEKPYSKTEQSSSRPKPQKPRPQQSSDFGPCCCFGTADETKRAPRPVPNKPTRKTTAPIPPKQRSKLASHNPPKDASHRPPIARDPSSQTAQLLSLISPTASPQTTAHLLAELAKPVSEYDDEGFIYMFWLTPEDLPSEPAAETASSLLASRPVPGKRRTSDVLNTFAANTQNATTNKKTILLKIGRAQNVQRRLNQWTRQCGYNLSLIRYYPYHPTTLSESDVNRVPRTPRRVPNAHKVERLIHIELSGKRAQGGGKCGVCGREHREWFEVEPSREGVRGVDEVVRRWVDWGEGQGGA